jgi:hypothetical protein
MEVLQVAFTEMHSSLIFEIKHILICYKTGQMTRNVIILNMVAYLLDEAVLNNYIFVGRIQCKPCKWYSLTCIAL